MPIANDKITDTIARGLPAPLTSYAIYWCPHTPGFGVRVTHTGAKAWIVERRVDGATVRRTVGKAVTGRGAITATLARKLAASASGDLAMGVDTIGERKAERAKVKAERKETVTLAQAFDAYVDRKQHRSDGKTPMKPRSAADYLGAVRAAGIGATNRKREAGTLHALADVAIGKLTGDAIRAVAKRLERKGPTQAARAMRMLRAVLRFHGVKMVDDPFALTTAQVERVQTNAGRARDRIVSAADLPRWWKATEATANGDSFRFLLLTGLRRGEAGAARVRDLDIEARTLRVGDTKNHRPHVVYLSRQALAIATARAEGREPDDFLFPAQPQRTLRRIVESSGVAFSAHDLRRTFASIGAALVPVYALKSMLNHAGGSDVTFKHYVVADDHALRAAWQTVADFIESKVNAS